MAAAYPADSTSREFFSTGPAQFLIAVELQNSNRILNSMIQNWFYNWLVMNLKINLITIVQFQQQFSSFHLLKQMKTAGNGLSARNIVRTKRFKQLKILM